MGIVIEILKKVADNCSHPMRVTLVSSTDEFFLLGIDMWLESVGTKGTLLY